MFSLENKYNDNDHNKSSYFVYLMKEKLRLKEHMR